MEEIIKKLQDSIKNKIEDLQKQEFKKVEKIFKDEEDSFISKIKNIQDKNNKFYYETQINFAKISKDLETDLDKIKKTFEENKIFWNDKFNNENQKLDQKILGFKKDLNKLIDFESQYQKNKKEIAKKLDLFLSFKSEIDELKNSLKLYIDKLNNLEKKQNEIINFLKSISTDIASIKSMTINHPKFIKKFK